MRKCILFKKKKKERKKRKKELEKKIKHNQDSEPRKVRENILNTIPHIFH
jgi:hypothetical protein